MQTIFKEAVGKYLKQSGIVFAFSFVLASFALAQTIVYTPVVLTSPENLSLKVEIRATTKDNGKWNYQLNWQRTLDLQGSVYITPKTDKTSVAAFASPAKRVDELNFKLNPATRYRLEFYSQPGGQGRLLLRKFFNTLDAAGNSLTTAQIPVSQGGTLGASGIPPTLTGTNPSTNTPAGFTCTGTGTLTAAQISTISSDSSGANEYTVTTPTGTVTCRRSNNNSNIAQDSSSGAIFMQTRANNCMTGLRNCPEPVFIVVNPNEEDFLHGQKEARPDTNNLREIWVYATVGRPFVAGVAFVKNGTSGCSDPNLTIQESPQLPPGLVYQKTCVNASDTALITVHGTISGSPTAHGVYNSIYKTTRKLSNGSTVEATTRIRYLVMRSNNIAVTTSNYYQPNGSTASGPVLGGRAFINWNQSASFNKGTIYDDLDIWIAPAAGNASKHPDYATGKQLIATVASNNGDCNNSTRGGADPLQYGCGGYNWVVGNTLGPNLTPGEYIIYVTPWLPIIDRNSLTLGGLYGQCGGLNDPLNPGRHITDTDCSGYSWGSTRITIGATPSGQTSLVNPAAPQGFGDAAFLRGGIKYKRVNASGQTVKQGEVTPGIGSSSDQRGCGGNWTGGVDCGITISPNSDESLELEWSAVDTNGKPMGSSWESKIWATGYDSGNQQIEANVRRISGQIVPGGFGNNPSEGFMSSQSGSKTIPASVLRELRQAGVKSLYLHYNVWWYGCANVVGANNNYNAAVTDPNAILQNGQTNCQLAVYSGALLVVDLGSWNVGEITQASCRLPAQVSGFRCEKVSNSSYKVDWSDWDSNATPQVIRFYAGESESQVRGNCQSPSNCVETGQERYTYGKTMSQINQPFVVSGSLAGKTYWNKIVASCGSGGNEEKREVVFSCTADSSGNITTGTGSDWSNTASCVLPAANVMYDAVSPSCTTGIDVTGDYVGYSAAVNSYMATFSDIRFNGAKFDSITFLVDPSKEKVESGCAGGPCMELREVKLTPTTQRYQSGETNVLKDPNRFNEQFVSGLTKGSTYWNRLIYRCGQNYRDVVWSCSTDK